MTTGVVLCKTNLGRVANLQQEVIDVICGELRKHAGNKTVRFEFDVTLTEDEFAELKTILGKGKGKGTFIEQRPPSEKSKLEPTLLLFDKEAASVICQINYGQAEESASQPEPSETLAALVEVSIVNVDNTQTIVSFDLCNKNDGTNQEIIGKTIGRNVDIRKHNLSLAEIWGDARANESAAYTGPRFPENMAPIAQSEAQFAVANSPAWLQLHAKLSGTAYYNHAPPPGFSFEQGSDKKQAQALWCLGPTLKFDTKNIQHGALRLGQDGSGLEAVLPVIDASAVALSEKVAKKLFQPKHKAVLAITKFVQPPNDASNINDFVNLTVSSDLPDETPSSSVLRFRTSNGQHEPVELHKQDNGNFELRLVGPTTSVFDLGSTWIPPEAKITQAFVFEQLPGSDELLLVVFLADERTLVATKIYRKSGHVEHVEQFTDVTVVVPVVKSCGCVLVKFANNDRRWNLLHLYDYNDQYMRGFGYPLLTLNLRLLAAYETETETKPGSRLQRTSKFVAVELSDHFITFSTYVPLQPSFARLEIDFAAQYSSVDNAFHYSCLPFPSAAGLWHKISGLVDIHWLVAGPISEIKTAAGLDKQQQAADAFGMAMLFVRLCESYDGQTAHRQPIKLLRALRAMAKKLSGFGFVDVVVEDTRTLVGAVAAGAVEMTKVAAQKVAAGISGMLWNWNTDKPQPIAQQTISRKLMHDPVCNPINDLLRQTMVIAGEEAPRAKRIRTAYGIRIHLETGQPFDKHKLDANDAPVVVFVCQSPEWFRTAISRAIACGNAQKQSWGFFSNSDSPGLTRRFSSNKWTLRYPPRATLAWIHNELLVESELEALPRAAGNGEAIRQSADLVDFVQQHTEIAIDHNRGSTVTLWCVGFKRCRTYRWKSSSDSNTGDGKTQKTLLGFALIEPDHDDCRTSDILLGTLSADDVLCFAKLYAAADVEELESLPNDSAMTETFKPNVLEGGAAAKKIFVATTNTTAGSDPAYTGVFTYDGIQICLDNEAESAVFAAFLAKASCDRTG